MITREKWQQLLERMQKLKIFPDDLEEKFIIGSGHGGQNLHKTSSCVSLKHLPTKIVVKCQQERSREANRFFARRRLCDKIEAQILELKNEEQHEIAKIRRQKRRRSRRAKQKMLDNKHHQSGLKKSRKSPATDE